MEKQVDNVIIDTGVILLYFVIIILAGYFVSRRHSKDSADEFLTGGRYLNWFKTGLTLIAMSIDTGIMGVAGIGFVWGLAIHPNAVNLWVSAPIAAMFLIPIYWKTKIVTTPELLEKRFNVASRAFFSVIMAVYNVIIMGTSIYLGGLILSEVFGWNLQISSIAIIGVVGLYVLMGGMKTVLSINIYQSVFIVLTLITVGIMSVVQVGGFSEFIAIKEISRSGAELVSTKLPRDFNLFSKLWYPSPSGFVWASMAGSAWIACNFAMVQRLLAAKSEKHAQKAILFTGAGHVFTFFIAYVVGVSMRVLSPETLPDKSYITAIMNFFPVGVRGLLIAGLIASLISTIDGLLTSTGTLITKDIYLRFVNPNSSDRRTKNFTRIIQGTAITVAVFLILPFALKSEIITGFIQGLVADLFGVVIALFLVGIFSTRATSKAAFTSMIIGITATVILDIYTDINFVNIGVFSFTITTLLIIILSFFEKPKTKEELKNLTVFTLEGTKAPWVGLKSWPRLGYWIIIIAAGWWSLTYLWEWLISNH